MNLRTLSLKTTRLALSAIAAVVLRRNLVGLKRRVVPAGIHGANHPRCRALIRRDT